MEMNSRSRENSMSIAGTVNSKSQSSEQAPTSRGSTRLERHKTIKINFLNIFRISVREATPEADLYNYDFKDKWEKSVEEGGLPKKYDQYDMNGYRKDHRVKNIKFTSKFDASVSDDSAFGKKVFRCDADQKIFSVLDAKYDNVDKDWIDIRSNNYFSSEEYSAEDKKDTGNGRESTDEIKEEREDKNTKAWFVEF